VNSTIFVLQDFVRQYFVLKVFVLQQFVRQQIVQNITPKLPKMLVITLTPGRMFQIQEVDPDHVSDRLLRDRGDAQVLGPVHEPSLSGRLGAQARQLHTGKSETRFLNSFFA
jgi:hypothetical protein